MVMPGYRVLMYYEEPDMLCVVTFRLIKTVPLQTVTHGGSVVSVPGTTISTVMTQSVMTFSSIETRPRYTTTYTGYGGEMPVEMVF